MGISVFLWHQTCSRPKGLGPSVPRPHKNWDFPHARAQYRLWENNNQILHGDQARCETNLYIVDHNVFAINSDPRLSHQLLRLSRLFFITINKPRGSPKTGMSMSEIRLIRPTPQNKENPEIRSPVALHLCLSLFRMPINVHINVYHHVLSVECCLSKFHCTEHNSLFS